MGKSHRLSLHRKQQHARSHRLSCCCIRPPPLRRSLLPGLALQAGLFTPCFACSLQKSGFLIPSSPYDGTFEQTLRKHFGLVTRTMPSVGCSQQNSGFLLPSTRYEGVLSHPSCKHVLLTTFRHARLAVLTVELRLFPATPNEGIFVQPLWQHLLLTTSTMPGSECPLQNSRFLLPSSP